MMTVNPPMRLVIHGGSTAVRDVPASNAVRALLHHNGFRRVAGTNTWELPRALPRAMRIARVAGLIRVLNQARIPLTIDDQRPAATNPGENRSRLAEIYSGPWTFATGHQPYILSVAATTQVRGLPVADLSVKPGDLSTDTSDPAGITVTPRTASMDLADGRAVTWDEAAGWRDATTGNALPISQVADPATVAATIADLPIPATVDNGRDPARLDPLFEQALAVYRTHPGFEALQRAHALEASGPYRLLPHDIRAIQQWQPSAPSPARWEASVVIAADPAHNVAQAWTSPVSRSTVTSYRPASVAAQRQLRQARLQRTSANQHEDRQR